MRPERDIATCCVDDNPWHQDPSSIPFRHLLIAPQPKALETDRRVNVVPTEGRRIALQRRQTGARFVDKAPRQQLIIRRQIRGFPPVQDPRLRPPQHCVGRQAVTVVVLVYPGVGRHQVPQVAAGPNRPRQAVIDVDPVRVQPSAAPDAV